MIKCDCVCKSLVYVIDSVLAFDNVYMYCADNRSSDCFYVLITKFLNNVLQCVDHCLSSNVCPPVSSSNACSVYIL